MMFGAERERSGGSVKPGINSGFKLTELFTKYTGVTKAGNPWTAYGISFEGPIPMNERVFLPSLKTVADANDEKYMIEYNKREGERAAKKKKEFSPLNITEYLRHNYEQQLKDFIGTLNMYAFSFVEADSEDYNLKLEKVTGYATAEEFVANIDTYIAQLESAFVPENYQLLDWDLVVGKKAEDQYLSLPKKLSYTGRYAKISNDTSRELKISKYYDDNFIEPNVLTVTTKEDVAKKAANFNWGGEKPAE